ncbi:MAG TPA: rhomboid family intramembrane serine protease, partial [Hymenobacter sp.]|jgi:membrane associated rhomboid family serine protease
MFEINATVLLILATAAISVYAWSNDSLRDAWILNPFLMQKRNEWYRFLTSGFLHANLTHLIFNMFAFYSFGMIIQALFENLYGAQDGILRFLLLYLGGIIVSDIPTYFRHRKDVDYRSLGASGGVAAVIFASILLHPVAPKGQGIFIFPIPFPIQPFLFGFLYLGYSYYQGRRDNDNINHDAHFYGALYGILVTWAMIPEAASIFWNQLHQYIL